MSNAQGIAFLSFGLIIVGGGGSFPDPYNVRFGVDNGNGDLGTLTSPAQGDVRQGVKYGGDGTQYTGTLFAPAPSGGNEFIACFNELLIAQADAWGYYPKISINGVTVDFLYEVPSTGQTLGADMFTEDGTSWIQFLVSPFGGNTIPFQAVVILNEKTLQLVNVPESNHGIYRCQIGDPTRK